ncbi:DNA adenine methylase [Variovorax paradoxus]|uniref:site-specific DNA-methyltransferase (adenine-specific) n=1 Tax=Variovorax paradoxus (strain EPS) TaxID=595537 RepID=E6V735_VARPE|nr:Dam family site-specific DNA-(adenine-N6)-methyltransferase [Variovorax paradoxus]ADU38331.1 DNA adenine methylase [Variovorax paradoxus EPS]
MRPLLRWAGSKKQLIGHLRPYWEASLAQRYVEPFAGSAALFFDIEPKAALLGDVNSLLVEFYTALRDTPDRIFQLTSSWAINKEKYYEIRASLIVEKDPILRSAMFFYLNRNCFNGIFRTNMRGEFNVPFAATKTGAMPDISEIKQAALLLKNTKIEKKDFREILKKVKADDFVFLDPPYAVENRRIFVQYNAQTFGLADLEELSDTLHCIDALGAKFVMSYAISAEALHYFDYWNVRRVTCQRNVAGFSSHRRKAVELIVSNMEKASP